MIFIVSSDSSVIEDGTVLSTKMAFRFSLFLLGILASLAVCRGFKKDLQANIDKYLTLADYNANTQTVAAAMDQFYGPPPLQLPQSHDVEYDPFWNGNRVSLYTPQNVAGTWGAFAGDMTIPFVAVAYFLITLVTVALLVTKSTAAWNGALKKYEVEKEVPLPWPFDAAEWETMSRRVLEALDKFHTSKSGTHDRR